MLFLMRIPTQGTIPLLVGGFFVQLDCKIDEEEEQVGEWWEDPCQSAGAMLLVEDAIHESSQPNPDLRSGCYIKTSSGT